MSGAAILDDLDARGLVHDSTDRTALAALLAAGPVTLYHGIDPTADSLHVGNLIGLLALRRFQLAGHRPVALAGGATGMIGDPSGRSEERNLLDQETLAANLAAIQAQMSRFLDFEEGTCAAELVDNRDWTAGITLVDFLRHVGKHVTVNQMVAKESVRSRMEGTAGISFTEFSYMLLQAHDYLWLYEHRSCQLQIGGSDQWGNITAGIDLIRRRAGATAHGLTWPLLTRADGAKFGKSAGADVWLSPDRTSPYRFYQYWVQTDDRDVERFLLQLTLLPVTDVVEVVAAHLQEPERRQAQRVLADELTALVHGPEAAAAASGASAVLFGGDPTQASAATLATLVGEVPTTRVARARLAEGVDLVSLLVETGVASSRSDARRALEQGQIRVGAARPADSGPVGVGDLLHGAYLLVVRGKRTHHLVLADDGVAAGAG